MVKMAVMAVGGGSGIRFPAMGLENQGVRQIDATQSCRSDEIAEWLSRHDADRYAINDYDSDMLPRADPGLHAD